MRAVLDKMNIYSNVNKKNNLLLILVIIIAGIIAYSNSFDCSFHFDDKIVLDSKIMTDSATVADWIHLFPNRPLGILTFALSYNIHKLDVWGYHLVNLTIHLINALLIWWLTLMTFSTPVMKEEPISRYKTVIAFLTALLFITHPLATQSVTYIAQRFASLATLFYFLSLILFIKGRLWSGSRNISLFMFGSSLTAAICGMLTKEIVFTLPFAVVLYDYCFIKTSFSKPEVKDKSLIFSFIILVIFFFIYFRNRSLNVFDTVTPDQGYSYSISMKEYFFTQFRVILTYIRLFFLPINQNFDYDYPVSTSFFQIKTFLSFLVLLSILLSGVGLFKKYRLISFGIFWFFLTLSVESSIIPISQNVIFEHRTYLPSIGFFIAFTGAFFYFLREQYFRVALIIILLITAVNTGLTYQRNKIWKNEYTLWGDCLKKSPDKARVNNSFGLALFDKGDFKEAIRNYNRSILIKPDYSEAYVNRGAAYNALGQYQRAIEDCNKSILLKSDHPQAYINRGNAYIALGQYEQALKNYNEAIQLKPGYADAYNNRGTIYGRLGKYKLAIADFNKAITLRSDNALAYSNKGFAYSVMGEYQLAIEFYSKAITIKSNYADAYYNIAILYFKQGNKKLGCYHAQRSCEFGNCKILEDAKKQGACH